MNSATPQAPAPRLSFRWRRAETPEGDYTLTIIEERPRKPVATCYVVSELPPLPSARLFEFSKSSDDDGPRASEVYTVLVGVGFWRCNCPGSAYRGHQIKCRHVAALIAAPNGFLNKTAEVCRG